MKTMIAVLSLVILLAGCSDNPDRQLGPDARLRVTQHQSACCYIEGQMSYLQLRNDSGELVVDTSFRAQDMIVPALDETFPPGQYTLVSFQRPFGGNPGFQDPPTDECEMDLELLPESETFVTAAFAPGEGCTMSRTSQPLPSAIPDQFVFREDLPSCGEEVPINPVLGIQGVNPARTCFLEAWQSGNRAEVSLWVLVGEN